MAPFGASLEDAGLTLRIGLLAAMAALIFAAPAAAGEPYGELAPFRLVEEVRGGIFGDDTVHRERQAPMATVQLLSSPMPFYQTANPGLAALFNPRFETGAMLNGYGLTSYAFAGLNWRTPHWGPVFGEFALGGAVNNSTSDVHSRTRSYLGCPVTFRESAGLGFDLTDRFDIVGSIEHISHANLCSTHNPGITSVGLRIGYKF
jgi:hypothetical protein